jgi:hypothetical protein
MANRTTGSKRDANHYPKKKRKAGRPCGARTLSGGATVWLGTQVVSPDNSKLHAHRAPTKAGFWGRLWSYQTRVDEAGVRPRVGAWRSSTTWSTTSTANGRRRFRL